MGTVVGKAKKKIEEIKDERDILIVDKRNIGTEVFGDNKFDLLDLNDWFRWLACGNRDWVLNSSWPFLVQAVCMRYL